MGGLGGGEVGLPAFALLARTRAGEQDLGQEEGPGACAVGGVIGALDALCQGLEVGGGFVEQAGQDGAVHLLDLRGLKAVHAGLAEQVGLARLAAP